VDGKSYLWRNDGNDRLFMVEVYMKIVSIIPARGGSSLKGKNIRMLCGQPLISYSIADSIRIPAISETYVSTDSQEIADIALKFGAEVPFLRPAEISGSKARDIEWALHFLAWHMERFSEYPDYIVHLRPTTPFRDLEVIKEAIKKILTHPGATSLISLEEREEPYKSFLYPPGKDYLEPLFKLEYHLMPRQEFPPVYTPNGYVDVLVTTSLLEGEFHGDKILPIITSRVPEIDRAEDFEMAELFGRKFL
jgi:CMP-N-acetylneuraminic acid synthetase